VRWGYSASILDAPNPAGSGPGWSSKFGDILTPAQICSILGKSHQQKREKAEYQHRPAARYDEAVAFVCPAYQGLGGGEMPAQPGRDQGDRYERWTRAADDGR
jgi:hypothetical protein